MKSRKPDERAVRSVCDVNAATRSSRPTGSEDAQGPIKVDDTRGFLAEYRNASALARVWLDALVWNMPYRDL